MSHLSKDNADSVPGVMTTEVGSETDVKKEPEKVPEVQQQTDQPDKPADSAASASADQPQEESQSAEAKSDQEAAASPEPSSPPAAGGQKKDKGISRFLPPWLKRQKSQSQDKPGESTAPPKQESVEAVKEEHEETSQPKEQADGGGAATASTEQTEEVEEVREESRAEEVQAQVEEKEKEKEKEEEKSVGSADTQPVREEKEGESEVKESKEKESKEKEEEEEKEEEKKEEEKKEEEQVIPQEASVLSTLKLNKKMKMVVCHVTLLDGSQFSCEVEKRAKGQYLFFQVCDHLNLLEKDYFGLSFKDNAEQRCWLDPTKEIKRQTRNSQWQFVFSVKFYPPDPSQLMEDITRYLLCLQLRQDIASGRLPCSFVTHALLGSYTVQAELGDHDPEEHRLDYISDFQFAPNQTKELEEKVVELHKSHRGMTPAQADAQFLENAKKLSMYGVDLHHAKDSEGVDIMLGVCANGLLIYKDRLRINRFAWPKILKISYKRSNFYIKIRPGESEQFESTVGFKLPNHRAAKRVWKVCVEHHTFFRLVSPEQPTKTKFLTLGSKFRYSGRTQTQTRQASSLIDRPAPYFQRTSSKRISRSLDGAPVVNVSDYSQAAGAGENGPALELNSDSKSPQVEVMEKPNADAATSITSEMAFETDGAGAPERKDLDKTQEDVLKHQASISELKRSFMEATPEPRPSQWDKRLTGSPATSLRLQAQGSLEEELTSLFLSKACFSGLAGSCSTAAAPAEASQVSAQPEVPQKTPPCPGTDSRDASKSAEVNPEVNGQPEVIEVVEETVVIEEVVKAKPKGPAPEAPVTVETEVKEERSLSSDSESEEEAEYHAQPPSTSVSAQQIKEEPEEEQEAVLTQQAPPSAKESQPSAEAAEPGPAVEEEKAAQPHEEERTDEPLVTPDEAPNGHAPQGEAPPTPHTAAAEQEEPHIMNGSASRVETEHLPQVICCSEPPVVKTEMVTISDTFAAQKTEISTKEVPIVHTETKTITYEAAQLDGNGDGEPGVLMTAQTITSESLCTTTTTHITKTLKGGLSETRIEKRIVITGDSDIDHDQALAQAIKEAKEQHPDMSVTRVVVHKETELAEDDD
ncbi:band 4.1-like protein 2 isoform X4 [Onychostoma macrolepis]|uniref:band 4.1-like protein 2 isoform X4 n=1 Tax=Onychostoma macrolepis TaxID=369639 RepID=UPI00272D01C0|nr:band 4.1-like protein 2 isoform X4 [Onychostoma macrolepis]